MGRGKSPQAKMGDCRPIFSRRVACFDRRCITKIGGCTLFSRRRTTLRVAAQKSPRSRRGTRAITAEQAARAHIRCPRKTCRLSALGRSPGLRLSATSKCRPRCSPAFPGQMPSDSMLGNGSPFTVAGPRRICTGLPCYAHVGTYSKAASTAAKATAHTASSIARPTRRVNQGTPSCQEAIEMSPSVGR